MKLIYKRKQTKIIYKIYFSSLNSKNILKNFSIVFQNLIKQYIHKFKAKNF